MNLLERLQAREPIGGIVFTDPIRIANKTVVYKGTDASGARLVAKFNTPTNPYGFAHIENEYEALQRIHERDVLPTVTRPLSLLRGNDWRGIVFPHYPEKNLEYFMRWHHNNVTEILRAALGVAYCLRDVEDAGVVHNDLKPDQFLIRPRSHMLAQAAPALLTDFEYATRGGPPPAEEGIVLGTEGFLSRQRWSTIEDPAADRFAVGCILYELANRGAPYLTDEFKDKDGVVKAEALAFRLKQSAIEPWCDDAVELFGNRYVSLTNRLLQFDIEQRPQTREIVRTLEELYFAREPFVNSYTEASPSSPDVVLLDDLKMSGLPFGETRQHSYTQ
jgi:serine/threonine protein kinase